jgi:hypothetical protein
VRCGCDSGSGGSSGSSGSGGSGSLFPLIAHFSNPTSRLGILVGE